MKVIAKNRKALYDYEIERKVTAGIMLSGSEAKSARLGLVSLKGSFAHIKNGELWLLNAHITHYPHSAEVSTEPTQTRKLLVTSREMKDLLADREAGRAIVPLAMLAGRYIKVELGIGKGKKKIDKRQAIKKRDAERNIARSFQNTHLPAK